MDDVDDSLWHGAKPARYEWAELLEGSRNGWLKNSSKDMRSKGFFFKRPKMSCMQGSETEEARPSGILAS